MINSKCNSLDNFDSDLMPDIHSSSDEYAKRFSGEFGEFALGVQGKLTITILQNHDDIKTILDVGGGHGQLMPFIKDKGYDITIYGSHECCKKRVEEYLDDNKVKFEVGSLINLPYPDRSFDSVICYRQICHLEKWKECLSELTRVSKKIVIIDYPTYRSFNILNKVLFKLKKKVEKNTRTFTIFNDSEIKEEFLKNDFKVEKKLPEYFLPLVFYRIIKKKGVCNLIENIFSLMGLRKDFGSPIIIEGVRKN